MKQSLIIMQGPPGGGKTTIARAIFAQQDRVGVAICSTDDYFLVNGVYKFDPTLIAVNHEKNQKAARAWLARGYIVVVDNTNIHCWEARPYVQMAQNRDIPVQFVRVNSSFKSEHGVPSAVVARMRAEMEDLTVESVLTSKCPWE